MIVGQSCNFVTVVPGCFWPIVYPMALHFQAELDTDNDFCNSLLFSINFSFFSFMFAFIHQTLTFAVLPENGTLKLSHRYRIGRLS